jgi:hypothetical protein
MKMFFTDTNFFLECRKASDLQWHEVDGATSGQGSDIHLMVPSTVITEIERHKTKGNSRTAKRARDASAIFRRALTSPGHVTDLRPANPRVILRLPPVVKVDYSRFPNLDPTRPDHRIAAEYAEVLKIEPGLTVLTDDTLLTLTVRSLGFEPVLIPESWKLAPEKDKRDDVIERLQDELRTYKQSYPDMSIVLLDAGGKEIKALQAKIDVFELEEEKEIEHALASVQARFPMEEKFDRSQPYEKSILAVSIASGRCGALLQTKRSNPTKQKVIRVG